MNGSFRIGQICQWQNIAGPLAHFNDQECEVVGELADRMVCDPAGTSALLAVYVVNFQGKRWSAEPHNLRLKRPPKSFTGEMLIRDMFTPDLIEELQTSAIDRLHVRVDIARAS